MYESTGSSMLVVKTQTVMLALLLLDPIPDACDSCKTGSVINGRRAQCSCMCIARYTEVVSVFCDH